MAPAQGEVAGQAVGVEELVVAPAGRGGGGRGRGTGGNVARTAPGTVGPCAYCMQLNRNNQSLNLRIDHDELNCARVNEYSKMMDDIEEGAVKGEKANDGDSSYL